MISKDLSECEAGDVDLLYLSTSLVNEFARSEFIMSIRHKDWLARREPCQPTNLTYPPILSNNA